MALNKAQLMETPGGPGVTGAVKSGTGILISGDGTISVNPATNVTQLIAGTNITLNPANGFGAVTITAGGGGGGTITGVTAGTGLSGGGTSGTVTLTNAGVTQLTAGTNISLSGSTGNITISASGGGGGGTITGVTAGTGLSSGCTARNVTLNNTGVTGLVAGSNITLSGPTGNITISASGGGGGGVTGLTAGRGIQLTPSSGLGVVQISDIGALTAFSNFSAADGGNNDTPLQPNFRIRNTLTIPSGYTNLLVYSSVAFTWLYDTTAGNAAVYNMVFANGATGQQSQALTYQAAQATNIVNIGNIQIPTVCFCSIQVTKSQPTVVNQVITKTLGVGPMIPNDSSLLVLAYSLT